MWKYCLKIISVILQMQCFPELLHHYFVVPPKVMLLTDEQGGLMTMGHERREVLVVGVENS